MTGAAFGCRGSRQLTDHRIPAAMKGAVTHLLLLALLGTASAPAPISDKSRGWRQGRATFYGGSQRYLRNFPHR